jgi:hypothetical protein
MFDHDSRYYDLETAKFTTGDGNVISYKRRRFLPRAKDIQSREEIVVADGDRLDMIAAEKFGDPGQFWRICDVNRGMNPFDLTSGIGRKLKIPAANISLDGYSSRQAV